MNREIFIMQRDTIPFSPWERTVLSGTDSVISTDDNGVLVLTPISQLSSTSFDKFGISIDGGGDTIPTGSYGDSVVPFNCEIQKYYLLADVTGSLQIDVWKTSYADYPATSSLLSITGNNSASLSGEQNKNIDDTLPGWNTSLSEGDILRFVVNECVNITKCSLTLIVEK